jgi:Tol biopolymer transport system component
MKLTSALAIVAVVALLWSGVGPHAAAPNSLPLELLTSIVRGPQETQTYGIADEPLEPKLFAEGVISTPGDESGGSMSPDGRDFYFRKVAPYTLDPSLTLMCVSHYRGGKWTKPEGLPFSGQYNDSPPMLSPDGNQLFFSTQRPLPGEEPSSNPVFHIWVAEKAENGWGNPRPLPPPVNQETNSLDPSVTKDGTLYFSSFSPARGGPPNIYRSRLVDGRYADPQKLGDAINAKNYIQVMPYISPDEKILIFGSLGRPDQLFSGGFPYGRVDLYISLNRNGAWTPARLLGFGINSFADDEYPSISPDGRYLFFSSARSGFDVPTDHRMSAREIESLLETPLNGRENVYYISTKALELPN